MKSDPTKNQNAQWDIDRYLLSDPSLDRDAFEQRMLDDLSLAEQVAASVADLNTISSAARLPHKTSRFAKPARFSGWSMLVTAAALLMTVSAWQLRNSSNDDQLSQIANNWVAFEGLTTVESLEPITTEEQSNESPDNSNPDNADADTAEQSDWLVEAAREFYLAKNDGAAG